MITMLLKSIPIILIAIVVLIILLSGYVKAPTNEAYIISGLKKEPRVLIGRAGVKIPFLERKDTMIIKQISVDIKTGGYIPTLDFIGVDIDAVAKVHAITYKDINVDANGNYLPGVNAEEHPTKVTKAMAAAAMKNFLNMKEDDIRDALTDSLQGNMREIIGTQTLKDLCNDRKGFGDQVQEKAQKDMNALGILIVSCNIQKLEDEKGLIIALGQDNMSKIQKDASIAKAQAEAEVAIAEANARRTANDAKVAADTEIAQRNTELAIKNAELKQATDAKRAVADAAYEIQKQEQEKIIQVATVNAQIAKADREADLKAKEVAVAQQTLEAEINKKADAERYAIEQKAAADLARRQKDAEAKKYEQEKEADALRAQSEAKKFAMMQEAEGIKAKGEAEAAAIQAKGIAEAEAMEKKAEAMKKYGQAAMLEMIIKTLPEMAKAVAEPLSSIDKITIIDSGDGKGGASAVGGYVPNVLAKTLESVKETTGIDLREVMKADTYDAKVTKNINITGLEKSSDEVKEAVANAIIADAAATDSANTTESGISEESAQ